MAFFSSKSNVYFYRVTSETASIGLTEIKLEQMWFLGSPPGPRTHYQKATGSIWKQTQDWAYFLTVEKDRKRDFTVKFYAKISSRLSAFESSDPEGPLLGFLEVTFEWDKTELIFIYWEWTV